MPPPARQTRDRHPVEHRAGFARCWTWKSRGHRARPPGRHSGAPSAHRTDVSRPTPSGVRRGFTGSSRSWASRSPRRRSPSTWSVIGRRHRRPGAPSWTNHVQTLVAVDFFTVPTVMFKVLFVFVVLAHDRRRVVRVDVTDAPTAQWTAQQLVEAFPWDTCPRDISCMFAMRCLRGRVHEPPPIPGDPRSQDGPSSVPVAESVRGTPHRDPAPRECLDHMVVLNEAHLRRLLRDYLAYYHSVPGPTSPWARTPRSRER